MLNVDAVIGWRVGHSIEQGEAGQGGSGLRTPSHDRSGSCDFRKSDYKLLR